MKTLIHTNRFLSKRSLRAKILVRNAAASAKIEGISGAKKRIVRLLRSIGIRRVALKRA